MGEIIIIDILSSLDIDLVEQEGCGASEFQLHVLAKILSQNYKINFFSKKNEQCTIQNINYFPLSELNNSVHHNQNAIIIVQRMMHLVGKTSLNKIIVKELKDFSLRTIFVKNKVLIWCHDFINKSLIVGDPLGINPEYSTNKYLIEQLNNIKNDDNLKIIFVSNYQKNKFINLINKVNFMFEDSKLFVLHNMLHRQYYKKEIYNVNMSQLSYLSSWTKGLDKVLYLFDNLLKNNSNFVLNLLSPGYESISKNKEYIEKLKNKYNDKIVIHGKCNKIILSKIIGESLCIIGPKFEETFGCVYQEAYHLNTPVICDINCGAPCEIVSKESFINYNNENEFCDKIINLKKNREIVELNYKLYYDHVINKWINILVD
jgi:hypothetical protein